MAYSAQVCRAAKRALEEKRKKASAALERRREEVYSLSGEIREIDRTLSEQMHQLAADVLSGKLSAAAFRDQNLSLRERRAELLLGLGKPADYLEYKYACPKCQDTGFVGSSRCRCFENELRRAAFKLSALGSVLSGQCFENFDLGLYPDKALQSGANPRRMMEVNFNLCVDFAKRFDKGVQSMLLQGGTGLGKTHLSSAVANSLIENGHSVCYVTAPDLVARFENAKFKNDASSDTGEFFECDLLIIDDLGSEFVTEFVSSVLFSLINGRTIAGKPTIISTNLTPSQLAKTYNEKIASRILGEFKILPFAGNDVRILKQREKMMTDTK